MAAAAVSKAKSRSGGRGNFMWLVEAPWRSWKFQGMDHQIQFDPPLFLYMYSCIWCLCSIISVLTLCGQNHRVVSLNGI